MYVCTSDNEECLMRSYRHFMELIVLMLLSFMGYSILKRMFKAYRVDFLRAGFSGMDFNKPSKPILPEAQGVLAGAMFLFIMFLYVPVPFWKYLFSGDYFFPAWEKGPSPTNLDQRSLMFKSQFIHYLAGILSICCMIFLGFADDALDLPWRHKIIFPSIASLPLLMVHLANEGTTQIVVPIFLRKIFGLSVDIGLFYYVYMGLVAVFCTNAINIYAGINGLEVGQSLIISGSIILFNVIELSGYLWRVHLFSLYFLIPFVAVSFALYRVNRFPASVFVGDTFCYFAGMTFAVVGILGHFSKTLLLFFLPQIFNYFYSIPQLHGYVPCPRHRMPSFNAEDGLLYPSKVRFHPKSLNGIGQFTLSVCARIGLVQCQAVVPFHPLDGSQPNIGEFDNYSTDKLPSDTSLSDSTASVTKPPVEEIVEVTNFTVINLVLRLLGPMTEKDTTKYLLLLQVLCSCIAFIVRYPMAWLFYGVPTS